MIWLAACTGAEPEDSRAAGPEVDVLVIGAGVAGLAAASDAVAAGASVRVLEREGAAGGAAMWANGLMLFSGSQLQAESGIEDSPEILLAEWAEFTGGDPEDEWVRHYAEQNVPAVFDWLTGLGVEFMPPRTEASIGEVARAHEVIGGGPVLVDALLGTLPEESIRFDTEAVDLGWEGDAVRVDWEDDDGSGSTLAGAVVVATGGFMHDLERVRGLRPELDGVDLLYDSWPGNDGNGLDLLQGHGAATQKLEVVGLYAHGTPDLEGTGWAVSMPFCGETAWVNLDGLRFADESDFNGFRTGSTLAAQAGGAAWVLFDADVASHASFGTPDFGYSYSLEQLLDAGAAVEAADLEGLASALGLDSAGLGSEIEAFNAYATGDAPDSFRGEGSYADAVDQAPLYAVPMAPGVAKGFGGIDTDLSGRVLGTDGEVLPHVFAAGELSGMAGGSLVGDSGFTGSLSAVLLSGRVAGAAAAAD